MMSTGTTPDYQVNSRDPFISSLSPSTPSNHLLGHLPPLPHAVGRGTLCLDYGDLLTSCPLPVSLLQRPGSPHHRPPPSPRGHRTPPRKPTPPAKRSVTWQASPSPGRRPSPTAGFGPAWEQPPLSRCPARRAASPTAWPRPRTRGSSYRQVEPGHPDLCPQTSMTLEVHSPQTIPLQRGCKI